MTEESLLTPEEKEQQEKMEELVSDNLEKEDFELEAEEGPAELKDYQDTVVDETLIFPLAEKERANLADDMVKLNNTKRDKEREFDILKKKFKNEISDLAASIEAVLDVIENGEECVVTCTKRVHFDRGEVEFIYNGQVMKTRKITDKERNPQLVDANVDGEDFISETEAQDAGFGDTVISEEKGEEILEKMSDEKQEETNGQLEQGLEALEEEMP